MTPDEAYEVATTDEVAAVFGRAAPTYDTIVPFFTSFGTRLVDMAALALGERVLDAGCGRGATLLPASVAVGPTGRVVGVDLAEEMVALMAAELEAAGIDNATVRRGDAQALDIEADTFDVVLSQMVLHLLPEPERAAAELFRVVVPGGRCAASAPTASSGWQFLGELYTAFGARAVGPMVIPYRPDFDLPALLVGAGFDIARQERVEFQFHFADEQAWWDWGWSNGIRALYEIMSPDDLEELRAHTLAALAEIRTPDGIPYVQVVHAVLATKPA